MLIAKLNETRYRVDPDWASLPPGVAFTNVSDVCAGPRGKIYVLQRSDPFMLVLSSAGKLLDSWRNATITDGHYVTCAPNGNLCVIDRDNHRIVVLDDSGRVIRTIGDDPARGLVGPFNHPTDVAYAGNGDMFVSDGYGNTRVHRLEAAGEVLLAWGTPGAGPGEFSTPHSVAIDERERVWVADRENNRLQVFTMDGAFVMEVLNVQRPMKVHASGSLVYVTDQVPSLMVFDLDGNRLGRCRTRGMYGHGLGVDGEKSIYVAEMNPDGLTKFVPVSGDL